MSTALIIYKALYKCSVYFYFYFYQIFDKINPKNGVL